jgi:hypothetical protein
MSGALLIGRCADESNQYTTIEKSHQMNDLRAPGSEWQLWVLFGVICVLVDGLILRALIQLQARGALPKKDWSQRTMFAVALSLAAVPASLLLGYVCAQVANRHFDISTVSDVPATVLAKAKDGNKLTHYEWRLRMVLDGQLVERLLEVDAENYAGARLGEEVVLSVREGYFGWRWVESIALSAPARLPKR